MRLLFVVDGASPIARSWIEYFLAGGHEVHLVSSRRAAPLPGLASFAVVPVAFSGLAGVVANHEGSAEVTAPAGPEATHAAAPTHRPSSATTGEPRRPWWRSAATIGLRTTLRHWLGPLTVARAGRRLRLIIQERQPDLVHAMRIPFEAAMAAAAAPAAPLLISTWGNDLTLHAPASPLMRRMTRLTLERADGLHADCERDRRLAADWGFDPQRPSTVLPGNGGVRREIFHPEPAGQPEHPELARLLDELPPEAPLVLNPRGFRGYVRNDSFFRSVPRVLQQDDQVRFACVAMAGERRAERWIERLGVGPAVRLLPQLSPRDLATLMRRAQVMVSPSEHDGTPNTLLEAMACGAYPVLGRLESVAEWVEHGANGALVDPRRPAELAAAILQALAAPELRARAAEINRQLVAERADYVTCMAQAEALYKELVGGG